MRLTNDSQAVRMWTEVLGQKHVIADEKQLRKAMAATYKTTQEILGILKPHTIEELQKVVVIAGQHKTPLYTISTGKNWGYGSRTPIQGSSYLLDLSRMNQIVDYDEELGYVTVEPGVTQKQLYDFLKNKQSPFSLSITGSSPDTSIVGNICERGVGGGLYSFRAHYISSLEVVLPSGKCIHTGYGRFSNAQAAPVYPEGLGPSFKDIFIQSNLGIITKLTLFLAPTPVYTQFIDMYVANEHELRSILTCIRSFNFSTNSRKAIAFHNDMQILASRTQYPWDLTNGKSPLPSDVITQLKRKYDVNYAWWGVIEIYGYTRQEVTAQTQHLESLIKGMGTIDVSPQFSSEEVDARPKNIGKGSYWRMKTKPPKIKNPDLDGCGSIRISAASPFKVQNITEVTETFKKVITQFGYEPFIEIHCVSERATLIVANLLFDRTVDGEDTRALHCHDAVLNLLMKQGYYPYRLNTHATSLLPDSTDDYDAFQHTIKVALDPLDIFSPGRYKVQ